MKYISSSMKNLLTILFAVCCLQLKAQESAKLELPLYEIGMSEKDAITELDKSSERWVREESYSNTDNVDYFLSCKARVNGRHTNLDLSIMDKKIVQIRYTYRGDTYPQYYEYETKSYVSFHESLIDLLTQEYGEPTDLKLPNSGGLLWKVKDHFHQVFWDKAGTKVTLLCGEKMSPDALSNIDTSLSLEGDTIKHSSRYMYLDAADLQVGMTQSEVRKIWGEPTMSMTIMDETVWTFGEYMVTFKEDKMTTVEKAGE